MVTRKKKNASPTRRDAFDEAVRRASRWWEGLLPAGQPGGWSDVRTSTIQRKLFTVLLVLAGVVGAVYSWRAEGLGISFALSVIVAGAGIALGLARADQG
jgi:hypothetical protein